METFVETSRYINNSIYNIYQVDLTIIFIRLINSQYSDYKYLIYDDFLKDVVNVLNKVFEIDSKNIKIILNIYYKGLKAFINALLKYYPQDIEIQEIVRMYKLLELSEVVRCPYKYHTHTSVHFYTPDRVFHAFKAPSSDKLDKLKTNLKEFIKNKKL